MLYTLNFLKDFLGMAIKLMQNSSFPFRMFLLMINIFISVINLVKGDKLWRQVLVSETNFQGNPEMILETLSLNRLHCGMSCTQNCECTTWCHDEQTTSCLLTKFWVSPMHLTMTSSNKVCFTNLEKDFIVGSAVTFSPVSPYQPTRTPWNLVLGIFDGENIRTCGGSDGNIDYPWMLFDLFQAKKIREVRIMTQNYVWDPDLANAAEVKIGKLPPNSDGDFSGFKYFGALPNPVQPSTTYVLKPERPIQGRYLSIQKPEASSKWVICYVMAL